MRKINLIICSDVTNLKRNEKLRKYFEGKFMKEDLKIKRPQSIIFEYIKKKNKIVGLLMGWRVGNKVGLGYSLCNRLDEFSWEKAVYICYSRMFAKSEYYDNMPHSIKKLESKFMERCEKYFKCACCVFSKNSMADTIKFRHDLPKDLKNKINKEVEKRKIKERKDKWIEEKRKSVSGNKCLPDGFKSAFFTGIQISSCGKTLILHNRKDRKVEGGCIEVFYKIHES